MKNKNLLLLPLFLFLPVATQCMEQAIVVKPRTMQEIRNDRDKIYRDRLIVEKSQQVNGKITLVNAAVVLDHILFQDDFSKVEKFLNNKTYKEMRFFKEYSYLGIAVIAIKRPSFTHKNKRGQRTYTKKVKNLQPASYKEKKEYIQKLHALGFEPTDGDKELAQLVYEDHKSITAKKNMLLKYSSFLSEIKTPQEIVSSISLLMFETEELLL